MTITDCQEVKDLIAIARREDFGAGDITTSLLGCTTETASFQLLAKEPGIFAGRDIVPLILDAYDQDIQIEWTPWAQDAATIERDRPQAAVLNGSIGSILAVERVLLNFLQRLCGVATLTGRFVDAVTGTEASIYDTRKTIPGWRVLDKYAVACGGGCNHRMGLHDAVLIKDNHLAGVGEARLASTVFGMLNTLAARADRPSFVAVEADRLEQVEQLMKVVGVDVVVLDNFSIDALRQAVALRNRNGLTGKVALEASGGITLGTVREVAETGVDRISIGALTHSATALDLSLEAV